METTATITRPVSLPLSLRLSGSALKIIAIVSMVIDHCAYFLMDEGHVLYHPMRCVGRIAFPVFAFLVAEGFAHSRNRLKYLLTLLAFGLVSELSWYLLNGADGTHNVMFTLALGVIALALFDRLQESGITAFLAVALPAAVAWWLGTDYDWRGVAMIAVFYILRQQTMRPWISRNNISFPSQAMLQIIFAFPFMAYYDFAGAILASIVIFLYDGTRGCITGRAGKYGFYAIYPMHLIVIWSII